ncbi:MAG: hypothetical protein H6730_09315 [Deltaproteobacteria bacterium]|nr:hypothetical protein [Deltaproteobacteria bacterium]
MCASLDALGPVRWLVVPNCFHHLATPAFAARYPEARVVGPSSALGHNPELHLHETLEGGPEMPGIDQRHLAGVPFLDETVFFHRPTGTLIAADLVLSAGPSDHFTWRTAARLTGCYGRVAVPPDVRKKTKASKLAADAIDALLALPVQRLLVAHADPIEDRPPAGHRRSSPCDPRSDFSWNVPTKREHIWPYATDERRSRSGRSTENEPAQRVGDFSDGLLDQLAEAWRFVRPG